MAKRRFGIDVFWCLLVVLLTGEQSFGQQAFITVLDKVSDQPVPFAHVCLEGLKTGITRYSTTSMEGKALNDCREPSKLAVSFVGYATFRDTIEPGASLTIFLNPTVLNMEEVVVTAQYAPEKADKSIYKVEVITSREIELKAATNMADLLKDEVSMNVRQDGVLGTSLKIQGLSGENVKFLVDGVPLIGRMNGNFDLNQINLNNTDRVEIIEGPMSVIYGSNALAGVVNLISRENRFASLSSVANIYIESVGIYNMDASISMMLKRHTLGISAGRYFFGGYSPPADTGRSQVFKPRRQYFADGYYALRLDRLKIKLSGDYFSELLVDKGDLQPRYYETAFDSYFTTVRYSFMMDLDWKLKAHLWNMILSWSAYDRIKETFLKDLTTLEEVRTQDPEQQDTSRIRSLMGRLTLAKNNPERKFNYQLGVDLNRERAYGKRILGTGQEIGDYALFFSVRWDPVKALSFQPGFRIIYNTKYQAPLVYAVSGKWEIVHGLSARVSYSKGFRAPTIKELYLSFIDTNHEIYGNPDLKAETSQNVNLTMDLARESGKMAWKLELSGFFNAIRNIITLAQVPGLSSDLEYSYVNLDRYWTTGGQFGAAFSLYPSLNITAGAALTGARVELAGGAHTQCFLFATDVTASASYRFVRPETTLALMYKYTGKQPQPYMDEDSITLGMVGGYNTLDFTATKGFWKNRIRLSVGVKNIFNNQMIPSSGLGGGGHSGGSGDGMAIGYGRTCFIRLTLNFNRYK